MIDINELRQSLGAVQPEEVAELLDRLEAAESVLKDFGTTAQEVECWLERYRCIEREAESLRTRLEAAEADALEQARLNGMGGEREAALMAKLEAAEKERDALRAENAGAQPTPSVPEGISRVSLDFYWDSAKQHHIPIVLVEFEPVPAVSPNDAKGWQDRDRFAALITVAPEAKP